MRSIFARPSSASDLWSARRASSSALSTTKRKKGALGGSKESKSLELRLLTPSAPIDWKGVINWEVAVWSWSGKRLGIVNKDASLPLRKHLD